MLTLGIDDDGLKRLRRAYAGIDTDKLLAQSIDMSTPTVNRVINGRYAPGPRFIASIWKVFGAQWVTEVFKVVEDK
jgi:DNA-binding XRE family transcriptional regulator